MRAVGYCENRDCADLLKGVFLLNHGSKFFCPRCRQLGFVEAESRTYIGVNGDKHNAVYKEARVYFNFNAAEKRYPEKAVVSIPGLDKGAIFEIRSPLVKTEQRALKLAEYALCTANSGSIDEKGFSTELVINLNKGNWKEQIENVGKVLTERDRRITHAFERN